MMEIVVIVFAVAAAYFDIKSKIIPNMLILCMAAVWLVFIMSEIIINPDNVVIRLVDSGAGLLIGGTVSMAVYFLSRKGLGGGDVKFITAAGLYLGFGGILPAVLFGTILAAITGFALILCKKITRKDKLPLAPFLLAGITITVLLS